MKLVKRKFGLSLTIVLVTAFLFAFAVGVTAEEYKLSKAQFHDLTGDYLSNGTVNGEEIESGDALLLDFESVTQEEPLLIDLEKISVRPSDQFDTVTIEQDWSPSYTPPIPPAPLASALSAQGQNVQNLFDAAIVIFKNGAQIHSLRFKPSDDAPESAIEVDFYQTTNKVRRLEFVNLEMPVAGSNGSFVNGFKFDGDLSQIVEIGEEGTDYTGEIYFNDVRIDGNNGGGISGDGIIFTDTVGDVSDVIMDKLYVGNTEAGLHFANSGSVKDITLQYSERPAPSVSELPFALEENDYGIKIDGANVTEVVNFKLNYVRVEDNTRTGLYIKGNNHDGEPAEPDPISSIDLEISNALFEGNGDYGIFVGAEEGMASPAKLDRVILGENLKVFDNAKGGALFRVKTVVGNESSSGLIIKDSQFNEDTTGDNYNDQAFGLEVFAYEGIDGAEVWDSSFHDHDDGPGLSLTAPNDDPWYDSVEGVTVKGTSANNNKTSGLNIAANLVENITISNEVGAGGEFIRNVQNGITINGQEGVSSVTIRDDDNDNYRDLQLNNNHQSGLVVESEIYVKGLHVQGVDFNENETGYGAKITTDENGDIGSADSTQESISFEDVKANKNESGGVYIDAAGDFENHKDNAVVESSEFMENRGDGFSLKAGGDVKNPVVRNSNFISNKLSSNGLFIEAKENMTGATGKSEILGNEFAGNAKGAYLTASELKNIKVDGNSTDYAENNTVTQGNLEHSVFLESSNDTNSVTVVNNVFFGETDVMLEVKANGTSSDVTIEKNIFKSGMISACAGSGTGIVLDATDADINHNEFENLSTSILVLQENSSTPSKINRNNFLACCITIDASHLDSVLGSGGTLDATKNYWGEHTRQYIESTIRGLEYVNYDYEGRLTSPVVVVERLEIQSFTASPSEPDVGDTVTLEYTLKNVFESAISGQEVWIIVMGPQKKGSIRRDLKSIKGPILLKQR